MWPLWLAAMVATWGLGWTMERRDWKGAVFYAVMAALPASVALLAELTN